MIEFFANEHLFLLYSHTLINRVNNILKSRILLYVMIKLSLNRNSLCRITNILLYYSIAENKNKIPK